MDASQDDRYTAGQVSALLGIPERTVRWYLATRQLGGEQHPITHGWRIPRQALVAFMERHGLDTSLLTRPARVLVVGGDSGTERGMRALVRSGIGMEIERHEDLYLGLLRLGSWRPALAVLGEALPMLQKLEVLRAVRRHEPTREIALLIVAGPAEREFEFRPAGSTDRLPHDARGPEWVRTALRLLAPCGASSDSAR